MNQLEQTKEYLRQYIRVRNIRAPWFVWKEHHERARFALHALGGIASDWRTDKPYCTYYYPQKEKA